LYKEIPIPVSPALAATPIPAPIMQTIEITLTGGLILQSGYKLCATTQTAQIFNIIAEGLDYKYPVTLPGTCCNFKQEEAITGLNTAHIANTLLDGTGSIATIFTAFASGNGSHIKAITIKALQGTNEGMIRIFIGPDIDHFKLIKEICIPQTKQGGFDPSFKQVIDMDFNIATSLLIGASTHNAESFAITVEGASWSYPIV
jgi:hypothetical protein